ncbi:condensation domain-containing protein [Catenulispora yoronensis]|uniref:condensation domain-containing protein n=1 Tax=Catenulispora yoronensis TaxID=450799 RepID=UPI0031DCD1B6
MRVTYRGSRREPGPLTFGQANVLSWVSQDSNEWSAVIPVIHPVDGNVPVEQVAEAIGVVIGRHDSLRTNYLRQSGTATQVVREAGDLTVDVHENVDGDEQFPAKLARQMCAKPFELTEELPVRAAIVTERGAQDGPRTTIVMVITHMAIDVGSGVILTEELTDLVGGKSPADLPDPGLQPLDQAQIELSPAGQRRSQNSLKYWRSRLAHGPLRLAVPPLAEPGAPYQLRITSPAAALAITRIVDRTKVGHSSVVLAAVAAVLGRYTGDESTLFASLSANRFSSTLSRYVGALAQDALIRLDLTAPSFDALVEQARSAQLTALKHSQFDAKAVWPVIDETFDRRGVGFTRDWVFNDVAANIEPDRQNNEPAPLELVDQARPQTRVSRKPADSELPVMLFFQVLRACGELELDVNANGNFFSADTVEHLLREIEQLLIDAAAGDTALPHSEPTAARGGTWWQIADCQVQPTAVNELLGSAGRAFLDGDELVGYLARPDLTPRSAHLASLAGLRWRPTAVTPTRYVICATAPDDLDDLAAWRRQEVIAEGDGRPGIDEAFADHSSTVVEGESDEDDL